MDRFLKFQSREKNNTSVLPNQTPKNSTRGMGKLFALVQLLLNRSPSVVNLPVFHENVDFDLFQLSGFRLYQSNHQGLSRCSTAFECENAEQ